MGMDMDAVGPAFVGLLMAGIGVAVTSRPREVFAIRHLFAAAPTAAAAEPSCFGIARYQVYGLCCLLVGIVLALVPFFLP